MADKKINMKKPDEELQGVNRFYTHLVIFPNRKRGIAILVVLAIMGFAQLIAVGMFAGLGWFAIGTPLFFIGAAFCFYPETEHWEYKPWQARAEKYERNFLD